MDEHPMRWPRPGQHLIQQGQNLMTSAVLDDWPGTTGDRARYYKLVSGFEEAAERQYLAMTTGRNHDLDVGVFPLVTLWRQAVELRMKWLLGELQQLHGLPHNVPHHHKIHDLWQVTLPLLQDASPDGPPEAAQTVEAMLNELHAIDASATQFRSPTHRDGRRALEGIKRLDLYTLHEGMATLGASFSSASDHVNHELGLRADLQRHKRDDAGTGG